MFKSPLFHQWLSPSTPYVSTHNPRSVYSLWRRATVRNVDLVIISSWWKFDPWSCLMDELNKEKTKVLRIRREAKFYEMHATFTRARPNVANRLACFGTAMCNNKIVISMGSNSSLNGSFKLISTSAFKSYIFIFIFGKVNIRLNHMTIAKQIFIWNTSFSGILNLIFPFYGKIQHKSFETAHEGGKLV